MKKAILILTAIVFVSGCATTGQVVKKEAVPPPQFDWTPPNVSTPSSGGVTFAVVGGSYAKEENWINDYPFETFRNNMRQDFNELLTARGFLTTGPFIEVEEMTFPDKKACDLILEPTFDIQLDLLDTQSEMHVALLGDNHYTLMGNATIRGRVTLAVVESLSGTRMWNKSVAIDIMTFPWKGQKKYATPPPLAFLLRDEPGLQAAIAPHLEKAYNSILTKAWDYLNPEEMVIVKNQAMEVKEKTTFSGNK